MKTQEQLYQMTPEQLCDEILNHWKGNSWSMDGERYIKTILYMLVGKVVTKDL